MSQSMFLFYFFFFRKHQKKIKFPSSRFPLMIIGADWCPLVRFPDCHECQSGERTPWERLFFLPGPLAPKMLLLPPHTTYIIGFLCTWLGPGHRRNFWNSILAGATADLDAHPVCPLARTTHIYSISLSFLHGFATRGHFVFLTVINHCSRGTVAALKHTFHHWFTK